jgi:serine/threonine-protein kinase
MTLAIGSLLHNRYRIVSILAQGGMGAIYEARDERLGVNVAVKENLFTSEEFSRQFHTEATILANLRHNNLPRVTDHFALEEKGQYLVMDYIQGEDLRERLSVQDSLPEDEVINIGLAICDALSYLHQCKPPIIHRDIKPGNIKISPDGNVYLVDFGLAKVAHEGQITTIGAQALTPGYSPPEQYGQGTEPRSDIYSLGATLYAALTGKVPEDSLARLMGTATLTPIHQYKPDANPLLVEAIEKAMSVSAADRFSTAHEFYKAIQNSKTHAAHPHEDSKKNTTSQDEKQTPVQTSPFPGASQPLGMPSSQKPRRILPLIIGSVVLIIVLIVTTFVLFTQGGNWFTVRAVNPEAVLSSTITPIIQASETAATALSTATNSSTSTQPVAVEETFTASPVPQNTPVGGGRGQIAFVSDRNGNPQIYLMDSNGNNIEQLTNLPDGACQPDWSPDGAQLVFISPCLKRQEIHKGSGLFIINRNGTGLTPLISVPGGDFDPAWSPDGKKIAYTSLRDNENIPHIYIYNLEDKTDVRISGDVSRDRRPNWSPDGSLIAFETIRAGAARVYTMTPDGKDLKQFSDNDRAGAMPEWSPSGNIIVFAQGGGEYPWLVSKDFPSRGATIPGNAIQVNNDLFRAVWNPSYSEDGFWIAVEHYDINDPDRNYDIYRLNSKGGGLTRLTDDPATDFDPVWRPSTLQAEN